MAILSDCAIQLSNAEYGKAGIRTGCWGMSRQDATYRLVWDMPKLDPGLLLQQFHRQMRGDAVAARAVIDLHWPGRVPAAPASKQRGQGRARLRSSLCWARSVMLSPRGRRRWRRALVMDLHRAFCNLARCTGAAHRASARCHACARRSKPMAKGPTAYEILPQLPS